ncbi:hypothetical protein ACEPAI_6448 [Sanghuangporus weigelae]
MNRAKLPFDSGQQSCLSPSAVRDDEDDDGQLTPLCHPNAQAESSGSFFSRVKQTLSSSPLGNILGQNNSTSVHSNNLDAKGNNYSLKLTRNREVQTSQDNSPALTPRCVPRTKHVFTPVPGYFHSHSRSGTEGSTQSDDFSDSGSPSVFASSFSASCFSPLSLTSHPALATFTHESDSDDKWSPVLTSPSEAQSTPPLTPATSLYDTTIIQNPKSAYSQTRSQRSASISIRDEESMHSSPDEKKGKKPAQPFPYDTLLADISGPLAPCDTKIEAVNADDDIGGWWGLEYTLELSRRDSHASDTSTGEHSKSHESWAAIHQGAISPVCEDANFQDWQRWHRTLDKMELRRRRKRTIDFIEESEHFSSLYLDEMLAQRAIQIHEELLTEDEIYDALVWVEYAAERRPVGPSAFTVYFLIMTAVFQDPFVPPEKHNLSWVLKSHRSLACLRELQDVGSDDEQE